MGKRSLSNYTVQYRVCICLYAVLRRAARAHVPTFSSPPGSVLSAQKTGKEYLVYDVASRKGRQGDHVQEGRSVTSHSKADSTLYYGYNGLTPGPVRRRQLDMGNKPGTNRYRVTHATTRRRASQLAVCQKTIQQLAAVVASATGMARSGAHVWPDFLASDLQLLSCRPTHTYIQDRTSCSGEEYYSVPWCFLATVLPVDAYTECSATGDIYPLTPALPSWGIIWGDKGKFGRKASTDTSIDLGWHAAEKSGTNGAALKTISIRQPATVVAWAI
ncbi:hypothetical protein MYCTH_2304202 [Thermothelomyces thermophilus ATCC 42464]|uniref:Uncharacterized protein n=1 Tax=Thermothelomyces thermophilus (strain ATCC 42464 / BCRC 31852 / DSM 1799) TaxID=573729 RepID=G2QEC2_THET4|nr:uncharacterized protein MYCTH_2304202 [Thermothelomyces thermophilus ATCC 42464]AEO57705.1 hypothetical protein MYCTH_2304202 [Thermothelomyces thermophilus ATCC 42464]